MFFALWPDSDTALALHRLAESAKDRFGGRAMRRDTLHLTLAFIGNVARERIAELIAAGDRVSVEPFTLAIDTLGEWQRKKIVWAGPSIGAPELILLADSLQHEIVAAGFALEARTFLPHVTLVRNAGCATQRTALAAAITWSNSGFVLVESQLLASGASYEVLARWPRK